MRNKIFGVIGVLWGAGIIVSGLARGVPDSSSSYGAGQFAGFAFGFLLLGAGIYAFLKKRPS